MYTLHGAVGKVRFVLHHDVESMYKIGRKWGSLVWLG